MTDTKTRVSLTADQKATITSTYSTGSKTQAELATEFGVSLATVNKILKGAVKPAKRKYTSVKNADRNADIVRLFTMEKKTLREIAGIKGCTHQNISLILKKNGIDPGASLVERNSKKSAATAEARVAARTEKAQSRMEKLEALSKLWKSGASVEEIQKVAGLKSIGACNVKIVIARRKYPSLFPLRGHKRKNAVPNVEASPAAPVTTSSDEVTFGGAV